jgi:hypothetical protein
MDCQFLMALYTWVHYNSFVKFATVSVPKLAYMYSLLTEQQKIEFIRIITVASNVTTIANFTNMTTGNESLTAVKIDMDGSVTIDG